MVLREDDSGTKLKFSWEPTRRWSSRYPVTFEVILLNLLTGYSWELTERINDVWQQRGG